jgi:putative ABC transport system permease protein
MAEEYWPGQSPLGRSFITRDGGEDTPRPFEVVGVVANVWEHGFEQWALEEAEERLPVMYIPHAQQSETYIDWQIAFPMRVNFVARYSGENRHVAAAMREVLNELDPQQPIGTLQSLDEYVAETLTDRRFYTLLIGAFSAISLLLALMGIYGVMAYQVSQRVHEIGVRLALGAHPAMIVKMIVRGGLAVGMLGVAMGVLGALALTRLLSSWLWGVTATDPFTFASLSAVMLVVALIACLVPARRAARVDAVISLRAE